jgi:D-alanyl-D-alanine carboxypeptidase/D-alanyl-D-alanine-endopeptidase (penicillin-binding protein 4)
MGRSRRVWLEALALALLLTAVAQAQAPSLAERIDAALAKLGPHAAVGVRIVAARRGEVLYERNPDLSLNPASNMKLFTAAAALAKLGPDYRFTTRVLAAGELGRRGTLRGALVLQAGGDPVLETPHLEALADAVKAAGLRELRGDLLADDTRYDDVRLGNGWNWDDEPFYYSAQISALTLDRNVARVTVRPGTKPDAPVAVEVNPAPRYLAVTNAAVTSAAGTPSTLRIDRARGRNEVRVSGRLPLGTQPVEAPITVEEPALHAAELFRTLLEQRGIRVRGRTRRAAAPPGARELAARQSEPLSRIVALLNKPSDNLIAEMLVKELGYAVKHSGDWDSGTTVLRDWLKEEGIGTTGLTLNDGSGLSRQDLVTARSITDLLARARTQPWYGVFEASLPVAGVDGTLRRRLKGTPAEGRLHAKTGSLSHVSALSGYLTTRGGEPVLFSILINNYPGPLSAPNGPTRVQDEIATALAEIQ